MSEFLLLGPVSVFITCLWRCRPPPESSTVSWAVLPNRRQEGEGGREESW